MASQLTGDVVVAAQGIYSESSTALHPVGVGIATNDGRRFRYVKAGATALVAGKLQQASAEDTTNHQNLTAAVNSVGDTTVTTTTTVTLTKDFLAGGFLTIESATTGAGFTYKIKGNTAATAAVTTITLEDPIVVATTGTVNIDVSKNPYDGVVVAPTTATSIAVGFGVYNITAAYFGWICTYGPTTALAQGTVVVGDDLVPAETTNAGSVVSRADASLSMTVGHAITGIASTDYGLVFANI